MRQAPLLLEPGAALVVERALMREQAFLPARQEYGVEFEPLGGVQGHDRDRLVLALVGVHHQRDVLEKTGEVLELLHGADQLLEVFQPAGGVGRAVLLPHLGVAGFVEHDLGELGVGERILHAAPAVEAATRSRSALRALGLSSSVSITALRRFGERHAPLAGVVVQELHGGVAEPALGHVDDALEGEVVGRASGPRADRRARRGFPGARRSAGRRSRDRAGRG